jgi:hypothetical protein
MRHGVCVRKSNVPPKASFLNPWRINSPERKIIKRIRIRDPDPGFGIFTPRSAIQIRGGKKSKSGIIFLRAYNKFLGLKYLKSLPILVLRIRIQNPMLFFGPWIQDPGWKKYGTGIKTKCFKMNASYLTAVFALHPLGVDL